METWYNNNTYDSIQQPDFFDEKEMDWVKHKSRWHCHALLFTLVIEQLLGKYKN